MSSIFFMYVFYWNSIILGLAWFLLIYSSFSSNAFYKWSLLFASICFIKEEGNSTSVSNLAFKLLFYYWIFDFLDLIREKLLFFGFLVLLFFIFFERAMTTMDYYIFTYYYCWIYWFLKGWTNCYKVWTLGWKSACYYIWA